MTQSIVLLNSNRLYFSKCLAALGLVFIVTGCGKTSGEISATFNRVQDFKRSEIISNGPAAADGSSELLVVIQLMNTDGSPVKLFRPTYEVVSGAVLIAQACTTSNINGVSTCVLKANTAGTRRIAVTNIQIALQAEVVFTAPTTGKSIFGLISSTKNQTQSNFGLSASIGSQEPGVVKSSGTFKVYGGVQGEAFSR
jgi:hypothetical protein